jgi:hypothetical protein
LSDELGLDLPSLAAARKEARVAAAEMAKEGNGGAHEVTIALRDANGPVATVAVFDGLSRSCSCLRSSA